MTMQKKKTYSPEAIANAAGLAHAVGEEMMARLNWTTVEPTCIAEIGCGVGHCTALLQIRYPAATVIALEAHYPLLPYAKQQASKPAHFVCATPTLLPLANQSVDMVFANLVLPWVVNSEAVMREWRRVLRPGGLVVFSSLGPDTLLAWRDALGDVMLPNCIDMHDVGDLLTKTRFADPVLDVEYYTLTYATLDALHAELTASGMIIAEATLPYFPAETHADRFATTYEVVYGHAWGPALSVDHVADDSGTVRIPLAHLRRR